MTQEPQSQPPSWWKSLPGVITSWTGAILGVLAVATAIAAAIKTYTPKTDAGVALPAMTGPQAPRGAVGWIYAGNRIDDKWRRSPHTDPTQPDKTLSLAGDEMPLRATSYMVTEAVTLRSEPPVQATPGERPPMGESTGTYLYPGRRVVVDDILEIKIVSEPPERVWVWTHVTLENDPVQR